MNETEKKEWGAGDKFATVFYSTARRLESPNLRRTLSNLHAAIYLPEVSAEVGGFEDNPKFPDYKIIQERITDISGVDIPNPVEFVNAARERVLETDISEAMYPNSREVFNGTVKSDKFGKIIVWTGGDPEWQKSKVQSGLMGDTKEELPEKAKFVPAYDKTKVVEDEPTQFERLWDEQGFDNNKVVYLIEDEPGSIKLANKANKSNLVIIRVNQGKHKDKPVPEGVVQLDGIENLKEFLEEDTAKRGVENGEAAVVYDFDGTLCQDDARWKITGESLQSLLEEKNWL